MDGTIEKGILHSKKTYRLFHDLLGEARHAVVQVLVIVNRGDEHMQVVEDFLRLSSLRTCHWYECCNAGISVAAQESLEKGNILSFDQF